MKKKNFSLILIIFAITLGIGYAYLNTTLNINGTTNVHSNSWDVYWDNVQVTSGSVNAETPEIDTAKTTVSFEVDLDKPGDFFEFTVDAKNDGSVDAMIDTITSKLNGVEITTLPTYLDYSLTYLDGEEIKNNDLLWSGGKETYKVRVEYKKDISPSDLPSTSTSHTFTIQSNYVQGSDINPDLKELDLGDYVSYTPTITSYTIDTVCTGYTSEQTINPSELNIWRVINKKHDGTIELVSHYTSSTSVAFRGREGYLDFVGCLNLISSKYETENITVGSRHMGYNGQTEYITDTSKLNNNITNPWLCNTGESCAPEQDEALGGGDLLYIKDQDLVNNALGTLYATNPSGYVQQYWLASRVYSYVEEYSYDVFLGYEPFFAGRSANSIGRNTYLLKYTYEDGAHWEKSSATGITIRPIVVIGKNIKVTSGSGTEESPYVIAAP